MSSRANIKLIDEYGNELWFYRHCDGYPEGTMPLLNKFLDMVKAGKIRDNVSQAGGWLIILGREEEGYGEKDDWKVGAIEPTIGQHRDVKYLYIIDLKKKKIRRSGSGRC